VAVRRGPTSLSVRRTRRFSSSPSQVLRFEVLEQLRYDANANQASKPASQQASKPASQQASKTSTQQVHSMVNTSWLYVCYRQVSAVASERVNGETGVVRAAWCVVRGMYVVRGARCVSASACLLLLCFFVLSACLRHEQKTCTTNRSAVGSMHACVVHAFESQQVTRVSE